MAIEVVYLENAINFIGKCESKRIIIIIILGFDGLIKNNELTISPLELIVDFSKESMPQYDQSRQVINEWIKQNACTHVEFVLKEDEDG